jgi:hypothetical protein
MIGSPLAVRSICSNRATTRAFGIELPSSLFGRADKTRILRSGFASAHQ